MERWTDFLWPFFSLRNFVEFGCKHKAENLLLFWSGAMVMHWETSRTFAGITKLGWQYWRLEKPQRTNFSLRLFLFFCCVAFFCFFLIRNYMGWESKKKNLMIIIIFFNYSKVCGSLTVMGRYWLEFNIH